MRRLLPPPRAARHHPMGHRPLPGRGPSRSRRGGEPVQLSVLILAMLGVTLLGGLGLTAAAALMARAVAP